MVTVRKLTVGELPMLTALFEYNSVPEMINENARDMQSGKIDIFVLFEDGVLAGELHAMYDAGDTLCAVPGERAYLFAFRIHRNYRGRGLGKYLLRAVIDTLSKEGYSEFTIGVEDDNERARLIYERFGFDQIIDRRAEEYQGDSYEYNLYLRK